MKNIINIFVLSACLFLGWTLTSCEDLLTTNSSTAVSDETVESSASNLNMVLNSAYRRLYFNDDDAERVYAGLPGLQMYVDLGGADILSHTNMGGNQVSSYRYMPEKTRYTDNSKYIWMMMYKAINQVNIILDKIDDATGDEDLKRQIKGQALAIRGISYFHLIQNYQQTYMIAKDKPGVILRTSSEDPDDMPRSSTVAQCYDLIVSDLTSAKTYLNDFERPNLWTIDETVVSGILARVYLVMNDWSNALAEATNVYEKHSQLMTREQYRSGFDKMISGNYPEVVWAMKYTDTDNFGGSTQYNFWFNQDPEYGEGFADGPIYSYLNFFADGQYEALFEKDEDRYQFWKRTNNASREWSTKWAYDKYKHYGDANGAVQGNTRPEVCLMRGSEMLLIMAEASAQLNNGMAQQYLNRLQSARNVTNLTNASGDNLLEAIYIERRKELLCEGVTGMYDLLRLQKPLYRLSETADYEEGHYSWGLVNLNEYDATSAQPYGMLPSNDYRFICQIPELEIANNDALTEADQNPYSGQ